MREETENPAATGAPGPDADEVRGWIGARLDGLDAAGVARIDGCLVDEATRRPEWLAVKLGRFGQHVLVPARDAVAVGERVWVPYSRDVIKAAPRVGTKQPMVRETELELLKHYGAMGGAGRAAELNARGFEAVTATTAA